MTQITVDEFTGKGGAFVIKNGKRVRVEEATLPPEPPKPEPAEAAGVIEKDSRSPALAPGAAPAAAVVEPEPVSKPRGK